MLIKPKEARLRLGLSQSEMTKACGSTSVGTITKWDQGQRQPTGPAKMLIRLWLALKRDGLFEKYFKELS